ncbi:N-acetyltransferase [Actinophytocola sp.]|uniref:GNAT family N-acetyltransferase n=1 Tax=Actinophytocola sp. TaxID=1872138 RepID=UPI0025C1046A|nr:GNAT family N-acetyltransferase [Actinophytocola sp.]
MARLGVETVGCAGGVVPDGADAVLLIAMWISPGHRGRGIGDALVTEVVDWARENGWSRVELRVADGNEAARRLFVRNGFEPTGQREPLPSNPTVDTEMLVRKVS